MPDAVITGIGQSDIGRRLGRSSLSLAVQACRAAIADAGLSLADIDGVSTYPGAAEPSPGYSGAGALDIRDALGLRLSWFSAITEAGGQLGAIVAAWAAIRAGLANHVLCFRSSWESTAARLAAQQERAPHSVSAAGRWSAPLGMLSAVNWAARLAQRHFHEYGTTKEQLGAIATTQRRNAAMNPDAVLREPMTMAEYLEARPISDPLGLLDCDIPVDGATAVVVSSQERYRSIAKVQPIAIAASSSAIHGRSDRAFVADLRHTVADEVAADLWRRTPLRPSDVDVAGLYDGFSVLALLWLEALGFCPRGEGGRFVEGGHRISREGELPVNTGGGQLSAGRLHGWGHLYEVCLQLRGAAGGRQLARRPEVAVVATGGGNVGGAMLLTLA